MVRRYALAATCVVVAACKAFGVSSSEDGHEVPASPPVTPPRDGGFVNREAGVTDDVTPPEAPTSMGVDAGGLLPANAFADVTYRRFDMFERENPFVDGKFEWERIGTVAKAECKSEVCSRSVALSFWLHRQDQPILITDILQTTKVLRVDFALRVEAYQGVDFHAQLASIGLSRGRNIYFEVNKGKLRLGDQFKKPNGGDNDYDSDDIELGDLVEDVWARYRIYIDFEKRFAAITRDGVPYPMKKLRADVTAEPFAPERLRLGAAYDDHQKDLNMFFDDVGVLDGPPKP